MARALHDPECGYYATRVLAVGRHGDFSTSASAGSVLGEAIANWLRHELGTHAGSIRTVIEAGGGDGSLSCVVRGSLGRWKRRALQWFMVETSKPLRAQQEKNLGRNQVRWFSGMAEALQACDGRALIFHNELLDAFPVTLLQWHASDASWQEIWLTNEGGVWREVLEPADTEQFKSASLAPPAWDPAPLRDGQRVEIGTACRTWLEHWAPYWNDGAMLTLDYGDTFPRLYHRQPLGTVRAYFKHQRLTGAEVYQNMGRQDITADVNFSDLITWGRKLGWETKQFITQREFLLQHVEGPEAVLQQDPAAAFLLDEHGAGSAFKALIQRPAQQGA